MAEEDWLCGGQALIQLDGNISIDSSVSATEYKDSAPIPVVVGYRPDRETPDRRTPVRKTVKRSNKLVDALSAPRITLYNMRSAWSKLDNLAEDMSMRQTDISFLTEVWQEAENKRHLDVIEELLELRGIKYVSTPRPGARRSGGTALACSEEHFNMTKLNVAIPKPLEACFALIRPKNPTGSVKKLLCCSFYSPPKSTVRNKLAEFLVSTLGRLRGEHPGSRVILAGDRNDLRVEVITALDPTLKQLVKNYTNKNNDKVLDVIFTDSQDLLQEPTILPPLQVDNKKEGKDSDHKGVQCLPRTNLTPVGNGAREKIQIQRFPDSKILNFGFILVDTSWDFLDGQMEVTDMVDTFERSHKALVDKTFPLKEVHVGIDDKPYFTEELRQIKRRRQRAYSQQGRRSQLYTKLKQLFDTKLMNEARKYKSRIENEVKEGRRGSGYKAIRKLGNKPGGSQKCDIILPAYAEQNLTPKQSANKLAEYFSAISQAVEPLNVEQLNPALRATLEEGRKGLIKYQI